MTEPNRILIVEDEENIADFISLELEHEGYTVISATEGREGLELAMQNQWDLILLDIMLPGINGMEICRRVRAMSEVPIIMLTARQSVPDRVAGLDGGADDYVSKPFAIEELLARIRVLLRRSRPTLSNEDVVAAADIRLNASTREVERSGKEITLTAREFDLLEMLMRNKNHVLTREQIMETVWGYDFTGETNVLDVYIRYLRNKVDVPFQTPLIQTVRGVGYILKE